MYIHDGGAALGFNMSRRHFDMWRAGVKSMTIQSRGGGAYCPIHANNVRICLNPSMCIHATGICVQHVNCACKKHAGKKGYMLKCLHSVASLITFLCIPSLLQLFPILSTQKTRVCSGLSAAHIAEKKTHAHTTSCWICEQSKEEKLNYECRSASNIGSHDTFPSVSQQEAVISLAPDCMCVPTADTFLMKTSILLGVYACVC